MFLISHPPVVVLAAMSETQNATLHSARLLATSKNLNSCSGLSPADVLGFGQRLIAITHKMPELELLQGWA
jgi:hypothetical protein